MLPARLVAAALLSQFPAYSGADRAAVRDDSLRLGVPGIVGHLRAQLAHDVRAEASRDWREHGLVFPSAVGTPMSARNLQRHFKQLLEHAGLPKTIRFHDLRHSCATFLIAQGVNPRRSPRLASCCSRPRASWASTT
jgi:hypothetical protein